MRWNFTNRGGLGKSRMQERGGGVMRSDEIGSDVIEKTHRDEGERDGGLSIPPFGWYFVFS